MGRENGRLADYYVEDFKSFTADNFAAFLQTAKQDVPDGLNDG